MTNKDKKKLIYKDENITLYSNKLLDLENITSVVTSTIDSALIGVKIHCELAKDPIELYNLYVENIYKSVEAMRKILVSNKTDE